MLNESIKKLVAYGMETGLVPECERNYTINLLLDLFHQDDYEEPQEEYTNVDLESTLKELLDEAVTRGIIEYQDYELSDAASGTGTAEVQRRVCKITGMCDCLFL